MTLRQFVQILQQLAGGKGGGQNDENGTMCRLQDMLGKREKLGDQQCTTFMN